MTIASRKPRHPQDRVLLNFSGGQNPEDELRLHHLYENIAILGSTGSGKTSGSGFALASSLLDARGIAEEDKVGMVVFLYKQGDAEDWLRWSFAAGRQDDVIHIQSHHTDVFNPLERYQNQEPLNAVEALTSLTDIVLGGGDRKGSEAFWLIQQRIGLDRLIRLCQLAGLPLNIATLHQLHQSAPINPDQIHDERFQQYSFCWQMIAQAAEKVGADHEEFRMVEHYFLWEIPNLSPETASSIRALISGILQPFVSSKLLNGMCCGKSNLRLKDAFSGKIILLDVPVQIHETVSRIFQCIIKWSLQKSVEQRDQDCFPNPLIFWQDEAQAFLMPRDFAFMSTARSSKAGSVILSQNISNFYATLGGGPKAESQINSLLALCNTKIFHANNDAVTNEWAAKTIGMGIRTLKSTTVGRDSESVSSSQQRQFLVEPRTFTMFRTGGAENDYLVDAVVTGTGRVFSSGANFLHAAFQQPFAR